LVPRDWHVAVAKLADEMVAAGFTEISPKMTAIIAYVLGEEWPDPQIGWMSVSSDGYVTTDADFYGDAADLDRNIRKLVCPAVPPACRRSPPGREPTRLRRTAALVKFN